MVFFIPVVGFQLDATPEKTAQEVADSWLKLLDAQKYNKSWEELSPNTKQKMGMEQWKLAMTGIHKPLGKLKERKFEEAEYIKSLHGYPDLEGVIVRYKSKYEKRGSVVETVGTIHDKDGKWRVVAYLTN
jgi:hypothetical protein